VAGFMLGRPGHPALIPEQWVQALLGGNSLWANLIASVAGAVMYFATLTEVPILQGLLGSGMGQGPALALLLAGRQRHGGQKDGGFLRYHRRHVNHCRNGLRRFFCLVRCGSSRIAPTQAAVKTSEPMTNRIEKVIIIGAAGADFNILGASYTRICYEYSDHGEPTL
jgi:hypothetical protein